jgi:hypothetical protein
MALAFPAHILTFSLPFMPKRYVCFADVTKKKKTLHFAL